MLSGVGGNLDGTAVSWRRAKQRLSFGGVKGYSWRVPIGGSRQMWDTPANATI